MNAKDQLLKSLGRIWGAIDEDYLPERLRKTVSFSVQGLLSAAFNQTEDRDPDKLEWAHALLYLGNPTGIGFFCDLLKDEKPHIKERVLVKIKLSLVQNPTWHSGQINQAVRSLYAHYEKTDRSWHYCRYLCLSILLIWKSDLEEMLLHFDDAITSFSLVDEKVKGELISDLGIFPSEVQRRLGSEHIDELIKACPSFLRLNIPVALSDLPKSDSVKNILIRFLEDEDPNVVNNAKIALQKYSVNG